MWFLLKGWQKHEKISVLEEKEGGKQVYVLICGSQGSCESPQRIWKFLHVFFYICHQVCVPCLFQCYTLTSEVNFTLSLTFFCPTYLYPTIHSFHFLDVFSLPYTCFISVYISVFPSQPKCDHLAPSSVTHTFWICNQGLLTSRKIGFIRTVVVFFFLLL